MTETFRTHRLTYKFGFRWETLDPTTEVSYSPKTVFAYLFKLPNTLTIIGCISNHKKQDELRNFGKIEYYNLIDVGYGLMSRNVYFEFSKSTPSHDYLYHKIPDSTLWLGLSKTHPRVYMTNAMTLYHTRFSPLLDECLWTELPTVEVLRTLLFVAIPTTRVVAD